MPMPRSISQRVLAFAIFTSTIGTYIALSPPNNATAENSPPVHDSLNSLGLTTKTASKITLFPLFALSLHTAALTWFHSAIPQYLIRHGTHNGLNLDLVTWTPATLIPLSLIFCVGIPLRLIPYATLKRDFTFFLTKPEALVTDGIYAYIQHPSYVGLVVLVLANVRLLGRTDGVVSCWCPPRGYRTFSGVANWLLTPALVSFLFVAMWTRVKQEETMLHREFGKEWEAWHVKTARFIPGVF